MKKKFFKDSFLLFAIAIGLSVYSASAQDISFGSSVGKVKFSPEPTDKNKFVEASAVAPIGDGTLLLVCDDERAALLVVDAKTGEVKKQLSIPGVADKPKPKWEALARDEAGNYYVIGSHSIKKKDLDENEPIEKLKARARLIRFRLKNENDLSKLKIDTDKDSYKEWNIGTQLAVEGYTEKLDALKQKESHEMVKIEGLAVRKKNGSTAQANEFVIGLRQPGNPTRVYAANLTSNGEIIQLRPLFKFDAGKGGNELMKLSSLEYVPQWKGFLILTSTEDKNNNFHGSKLWFLSDEKIAANKSEMKDLELSTPQFSHDLDASSKAEGLAILPSNTASGENKIRVVIVYDNDDETTAKGPNYVPSSLQIVELINRRSPITTDAKKNMKQKGK